MSREHPIWEEELMPYVDGQLDAEKAADIAEHLKECEHCASAVADAAGLSRQMAKWQIEDSPEQMGERVLAELRTQKGKKQPWFGASWTRRRAWTLGLSGAAATVLITVVAAPSLLRSR